MSTTRLVDRHHPRTAAVAATGERTAGAYTIDRRLVSAPGADLWAGAAPDGSIVMVQSVLLRAVGCLAETVERDHVERSIVRAASAALARRDVLAQGAADRAGGVRELYWILESPRDLKTVVVPDDDDAAEAILRIGLALAQQLARDHLRGTFAPLLDPSLVVTTGAAARLLGVQIAAPAEWLASPTLPWRAAPEESLVENPRATGDLWRLGQTLAAFAHGRTIPVALETLINNLVAPTGQRPSRATEVIVAIEAMLDHRAPIAHADTVEYRALSPLAADTCVEHCAPWELEIEAQTIAVVTMTPIPEVEEKAVALEVMSSPVLAFDDVDVAFFERSAPIPVASVVKPHVAAAWLLTTMATGIIVGVIAGLQCG